jgi:hypothetical protein
MGTLLSRPRAEQAVIQSCADGLVWKGGFARGRSWVGRKQVCLVGSGGRRRPVQLLVVIAAGLLVGAVVPAWAAATGATPAFHGRTTEGFAIRLVVKPRSVYFLTALRDNCGAINEFSDVFNTYTLGPTVAPVAPHRDVWHFIINDRFRGIAGHAVLRLALDGDVVRGSIRSTSSEKVLVRVPGAAVICHGYTAFTAER